MCSTKPCGSSVQGQNDSRTIFVNLCRVQDIVVAPFASFVCVRVCVWPESCSEVGKLNLKTRPLNPPRTCVCVCVCVCVVMRMYTACTAANYHTFICYTLPFPVLMRRRTCLSLFESDGSNSPQRNPVLAAGCQKSALLEKTMIFFLTSRPLCSRHSSPVQIRQQWWIKPWKLLLHRLSVCADEVSVDAKGLFVREALCYAYLGKLLYSYGVKYRLLSVL